METDPKNADDTQVFILRIWREKRDTTGVEPLLRGVIENLPSRQKRYVKNKEEIMEFISIHLQKIGLTFEVKE